MSQYNTILLVASPSMVRTPAFFYATHLAKVTGARLHICIFDYSETMATVRLVAKDLVDTAREAYIEVRRDWARTEASGLVEQGIRATGDATWAHPMADEILEQIYELKPDLVVKDSHHEPLLKRVLFTPVDWQLMRHCPAPLLLVNSTASALPRKIVIAIDPMRMSPAENDFNEKIIEEGISLAIQCGSELHLATAFNPAPIYGMGTPQDGVFLTTETFEAIRNNHIERFMAVADERGVPADRRHFLEGPAAVEIAELAESSKADVVVVGTTDRHGIERFILGSTAESILEYSPSNVMVVKPNAFQQHFEDYIQKMRSVTRG